MKLYDSKNHLTKDGREFNVQLSKVPVTRLIRQYLDRGASTADMLRIILSEVHYRAVMQNLQTYGKEKPTP